MKQVIGNITSVVVTQSDTRETGQYSLPIEIDFSFVLNGGWAEYVRQQISLHLAGCAAIAGLPLNEGIWQISIDKKYSDMFNLPEAFTA
jgi:hypothetical protein